jgi:hypothetical protein
MDSSNSKNPIAGLREYGNKLLGPIKAENFLANCLNYRLFKEDSIPWNQLILLIQLNF